MNDDDIKDSPHFKKLRDEAEQLDNFKKLWPLMKPLAQAFGADTEKIDENLQKADELVSQINEIQMQVGSCSMNWSLMQQKKR
jgi:hypothetical protein